MPTYAEYGAERERAGRRSAQDRFLAAQQSHFDADVAANTDKRGGWRRMKWERPQFAVVGEGTRQANENYRRGYAAIQWGAR